MTQSHIIIPPSPDDLREPNWVRLPGDQEPLEPIDGEAAGSGPSSGPT